MIASLFTALVIAAVQANQIKDQLAGVPSGWSLVGAALPDQPLQLTVAIKQGNMQAIIDTLHKVSDPGHDQYQQHLNNKQVHQMAAPLANDLQAVQTWLDSYKITDKKFTPAMDFVTFSAPVKTAQEMLGCTFASYQHPKEGTEIRTLNYSLPDTVFSSIDFIQPTTLFSQPKAQVFSAKSAAAWTPNSPAVLQDLYRMHYTPSHPKTKLGIAGFLDFEGVPSRDDFQKFISDYAPHAKNATYHFQGVSGAVEGNMPTSLEGNIDVQLAASLTYPTDLTYYHTPGTPPFFSEYKGQKNSNEPYLPWLLYLVTVPNDKLPQTISISYGI